MLLEVVFLIILVILFFNHRWGVVFGILMIFGGVILGVLPGLLVITCGEVWGVLVWVLGIFVDWFQVIVGV